MTGRAGAAPGGLVTVAFASAGDFGAWHDAKCAELGIPHPGYIEGVAVPAMRQQWTTAYATPWNVDGYTCVSLSAEEVAADPVLKGLEVLTVKYPAEPGGDVDAEGQPISELTIPAPDVPYLQPIPPTWTDGNGVEWPVPPEARR